MNMIPFAIRMAFSILVTVLKYIPSFSMLKAITKAKRITGIPVPIENSKGIAKPDLIVIGISIPKNKAPLYGQKANENKAPNRKAPSKPLVLNLSEKFSIQPPPFIKLSLMMSSIIKPKITSTNPIYFSPFP